MESLKDKVALVSGGGSGIGLATATRFAAAGATVVVADANLVQAEAAATALRAHGGEAAAVQVDVSQAEQCEAMVTFVRDHFGRLDIAFNNAGISESTLLKGAPLPESHELALDIWDRVLKVDLYGVFHCLRAELPLMLEGGGGAIVNTASLQAHVGFPRTPAYTAAKHGVAGVTKTIAKEYGSRGIRCNAVSPGVVDTPLTNAVIHRAEYREGLLQTIPLGRFAEPEDIAGAVVWLCSPGGAYVNGATLTVDGGFLA